MNFLFLIILILIVVLICLLKLIKYYSKQKNVYYKKLNKWRYKNAK